MPANAKAVKKKLDKKVIEGLGHNVTLRRMNSNNSPNSLDPYGEPTQRTSDGSIDMNTYTNYTDSTIKIVVEEIKLDEELSGIGGIPSRKEFAKLYISSSVNLSIGDQIIMNGHTYEIQILRPNYMNGLNVIWEVEVNRDITT